MTYVSMSIVILCIISTLLFKLIDVLEKPGDIFAHDFSINISEYLRSIV